jgi:hypothetical protein
MRVGEQRTKAVDVMTEHQLWFAEQLSMELQIGNGLGEQRTKAVDVHRAFYGVSL